VFFIEDLGGRPNDFVVWLRANVVDTRIHVYEVRFNKARLSDRDWETLMSFNELKGLTLAGCELTDERVRSLKVMRKLGLLDVSDCNVTDDSITALAEILPGLFEINLKNTAVSDSCIKKLHDQFPTLHIVSNADPAVPDANDE